jgi:WD40 repeat protein
MHLTGLHLTGIHLLQACISRRHVPELCPRPISRPIVSPTHPEVLQAPAAPAAHLRPIHGQRRGRQNGRRTLDPQRRRPPDVHFVHLPPDTVTAAVFSPGGRLVASEPHDKTVRPWDTTTGVSRGALESHSDLVVLVVFLSDGRLAASGSYDKTVRLWDATMDESHGALESHLDLVVAVVFSSDGRLVASGSHDNNGAAMGY